MTMCARLAAISGLCMGLLAAPAAAADRDAPTLVAVQGNLAAAASVDRNDDAAPTCLVPGQIRNFGGITMLTPRRAVTLNAAECAARGGELIQKSTATAVD